MMKINKSEKRYSFTSTGQGQHQSQSRGNSNIAGHGLMLQKWRASSGCNPGGKVGWRKRKILI